MRLQNTIIVLVLALFMQPRAIQAQDNYIFNHLSAEFEAGSTGWGFSISAPLTRYVTLRTGFTSLPQFSFKGDVNYTSNDGTWNEVEAKAKMHMTDFKFLAEIYPFNNCAFHITGGFYLGKEDLLTAERDKYGANDIKPGLTGWAQINGRDELPIDVKARLDGEYVKRMSFGFDLRCIMEPW